jgi:pimeloyl-ACP methyl ester carboxylesterase
VWLPLCCGSPAAGRPLLALEFKHVSMRWVLWVPTVDEVAEVLVAIMRREGVARCCLVGHSYGTAVASRLLQQHPSKVVQTCMIDPVSKR